MFFDDVICMKILLKLGVSKLVGRLKNNYGRMPEKSSDFSRSIEYGLNDRGFRTRDLRKWVVHMRFIYKITIMDNLDL
jgi:hypothetical protein